MSDLVLTYHIVLRWVMVAISCSAVTFIFWYFACAVCKKKSKRICLVLALVALSITAYVIRHSEAKVVRMKEDVLYIKPSSDE